MEFGGTLTIYGDGDGNIEEYVAGGGGYKKERKNDEVIGQVLRYMGWVRRT